MLVGPLSARGSSSEKTKVENVPKVVLGERPRRLSGQHRLDDRLHARLAQASGSERERIADSAAPGSRPKGWPVSTETTTTAAAPSLVSASARASRAVVFPLCRGACTTKYGCLSMRARTMGRRRSGGSVMDALSLRSGSPRCSS